MRMTATIKKIDTGNGIMLATATLNIETLIYPSDIFDFENVAKEIEGLELIETPEGRCAKTNLVIHNVRLLQGKQKFIVMPSFRRRDGRSISHAHPINSPSRKLMEMLVIKAYEEALAEQSENEE